MAEWIDEGRTGRRTSRSRLTMVQPSDLSALRGKPVVVYFYPKDDTPGCTREACAFRDRKAEIASVGREGARDQPRHGRKPPRSFATNSS